MDIKIDIEPEDKSLDLLINDYDFPGPSSFESHLLDALKEYASEIGKEGVVINSTNEHTEDVLESNGFNIVEQYDYAGLVTGVYDLSSGTEGETEDLEQKALADLDAIAEIADHAQAEVGTGDLDGLVGSVDAIANRASAWSDPQ